MAFDGSGGYAAIADHPMIQVDNSFTLEAWIKTSTPASTQAILAKRPRYYFGLEGGKLVFAFEGKPHARSDTTLTADRWHHVAVVIKPQPDSTWRSRICFFLDGRLDGCGRVEFQMTRSIGDLSRFLARNDGRVYAGPRFRAITTQQNGPVPTERLYVGIDSDGKSSAFVGNIDEVAVHNGALPDDVFGGHAAAGYDESGELTSTPIELPLGRKWSRFDADFQAPEGAGISFDVFDADGRVIRTGIAPGSSLEDVAESRLRLHARLRSATGSQTPVLRAWRVSWR